ncbi:MAG: hypothetical protein WBX01_05835 [Nitrososphaeraceae archaeon]
MSSSEENVKKSDRNSKEMEQANSRPDLSSRVVNSLYKFHESMMN